MRHLIKNRDAHIRVNNSNSPIPQMKDKKKGYITRNIKLSDRARRLKHINVHPINLILHAVDNNILQKFPILQEDFRMTEGVYGPSIPHLKGKIVRRKIQHVEFAKITSVPKTILDKYKEVTILCDIIHINLIVFLNNISQNIMFVTGSMIKNRKIENIADGIIQVHKLYLQNGCKITHMHTDCEFEPLRK